MEKYKLKLQERISKGSERSLSLFPGFSDFFSNDYLGLSCGIAAAQTHAGSTGSRLLSGNSTQAEETEQFLADFFKAEAALVFNSGYDANLGLFSSVPQRGDTILYDELIHASVRDGIRLSHAKAFSFGHNNLEDLTRRLAKAEGTVFVAVESLYSMDGDLAPLKEIAVLCQQNNALLIVDEAHSGGIFGAAGSGLCEALGISSQVFARVFTFGKAYGTHGAAVLGTTELKNYLINFARSFIYTTALPPGQYELIASQVRSAATTENLVQLNENIQFFRKLLGNKAILSAEHSPIQVMLVSGNKNARELAEKLQKNNLAIKAILSPTVPEGQERLRICIHAFNTKDEIVKVSQLLFF